MLNLTLIDELKSLPADNGENLFSVFVRMFFESYPEHIRNMQRFLLANDLRSLEREAHTLKSVCANLGAENLSRLALEIEKQSKANQIQNTSQIIRRMEEDYADVKNELESLMKDCA